MKGVPVMGNLNKVRTRAIPIVLDKPRTVKFDLNAYAELEDKFGSVENALTKLQEGSIKAVRALLWAGLLHEETDENGEYSLTERQVGAMLGMVELEDVMEIIAQAMGDALPENEAADGDQGNQVGQ